MNGASEVQIAILRKESWKTGMRLVGRVTVDVARGEYVTLRKLPSGDYALDAEAPRRINTEPGTLFSFVEPSDAEIEDALR